MFYTWLIINWIVGILFVEYAFLKTKSVRKVDEDRDSKFPAFRRYDIHLWSKPRLYLFAVLIPIRIILGLLIVIDSLVIMK